MHNSEGVDMWILSMGNPTCFEGSPVPVAKYHAVWLWGFSISQRAGLELTFTSHPYRALCCPFHPSKGPRWRRLQKAQCYALFRGLFFMIPLCLHRTAFMMKWKISGQGRRQNGRRMRSWSGKRSCYSKVSTSHFLMISAQKNCH